MSTAVIFVHGGGVREDAFTTTFRFLQQTFLGQGIGHALYPCFWGDRCGSRPPVLCIPEAQKQVHQEKALAERGKVVQWETLYQDALFELRLLKTEAALWPQPAQPRHEGLWARIECYTPSPCLSNCLRRWCLLSCWDRAWRAIINDDQNARDLILLASQDISAPVGAVARALVARLTTAALADTRNGVDASHRDELVDLLITDWVGRDRSVNLHVGRLLADTRTPTERGRREPIYATSMALGDALLYQARGSEIRETIRQAVASARERTSGSNLSRIVLLAHSLGGIACVDLLAKEPLREVTHLITVGSQAPYLYEIGALQGIDPAKHETLPSSFPLWLNLYDPNDFLSYVAEPVFRSPVVRDVRVDSGAPFPESHGAYWVNKTTWHAIRTFIA